jgi:hypothetical protein
MLYIVSIVVIAVAVVLGIFTGIWGGLLWIVVAGIALAIVFAGRARETTVTRSRTEPTGVPRSSRGGSETANERVGQP